jgi:hypothetical protein
MRLLDSAAPSATAPTPPDGDSEGPRPSRRRRLLTKVSNLILAAAAALGRLDEAAGTNWVPDDYLDPLSITIAIVRLSLRVRRLQVHRRRERTRL